jgi:hypothetical protein
MGCNCGGRKTKQPTTPAPSGGPSVLTASGGTQEFGSKLEADAAKIRAGGGTVSPR